MALIKWTDADTTWSEMNQIWGLVQEVVAVVEEEGVGGSTPSARKKRLEKFLAQEPEKHKKLIHLICRIEGVKVYDEKKEVQDDVQVTLKKIEMLAEQVLGRKIKVENPDVV